MFARAHTATATDTDTDTHNTKHTHTHTQMLHAGPDVWRFVFDFINEAINVCELVLVEAEGLQLAKHRERESVGETVAVQDELLKGRKLLHTLQRLQVVVAEVQPLCVPPVSLCMAAQRATEAGYKWVRRQRERGG